MRKLYGHVYLRPLRKLLEHVPQHGLLARGYLGGGVTLRKGDLLARTLHIDQDFKGLETLDRRLGTTLAATERFRALQANWRDLKEKVLNLTSYQSDGLPARLMADIRALMAHVGNTSNLILDPDLNSYYLMDAALLKLPEGQDLLAQVRVRGAPGSHGQHRGTAWTCY